MKRTVTTDYKNDCLPCHEPVGDRTSCTFKAIRSCANSHTG
jgi:hypothetical protein